MVTFTIILKEVGKFAHLPRKWEVVATHTPSGRMVVFPRRYAFNPNRRKGEIKVSQLEAETEEATADVLPTFSPFTHETESAPSATSSQGEVDLMEALGEIMEEAKGLGERLKELRAKVKERWSVVRRAYSDPVWMLLAAAEGASPEPPTVYPHEGGGYEIEYAVSPYGDFSGRPVGLYLAAKVFSALEEQGEIDEIAKWFGKHHLRMGGAISIAIDFLRLSEESPSDAGELHRILGKAYGALRNVWAKPPESDEDALARISTCYALLKWTMEAYPPSEEDPSLTWKHLELLKVDPPIGSVAEVVAWAFEELFRAGQWLVRNGSNKRMRLLGGELSEIGASLKGKESWSDIWAQLPASLSERSPWWKLLRDAIAASRWATPMDLLLTERNNPREEGYRKLVLSTLSSVLKDTNLEDAVQVVKNMGNLPVEVKGLVARHFGDYETLLEWMEDAGGPQKEAISEFVTTFGCMCLAHSL